MQNLMKLFLSSKNDRDWPKKWLELKKKKKTKTHIYGFRKLRVKTQIKTLPEVVKESPFVIL